MKTDILKYLSNNHEALLHFWRGEGAMPDVTAEAHCDMVYTLFMLDDGKSISGSAAEAFYSFLNGYNLPGWGYAEEKPVLSVHNVAYVFGALNLISESLSISRAEVFDKVLAHRKLDLGRIVDPTSSLPVFPRKWAHHNWRVSHWIGGIPSLILSVAESGGRFSEIFKPLSIKVRDATDAYINKRTGIIKAWRNPVIQQAFRFAYSIRHDPDLGDIGGVAHILWVDHAMGRKYIAAEALLAQSQNLMLKHSPFMEKVPYCLDFDIVQIVRTGLEQTGSDRGNITGRAKEMMSDISAYFATGPGLEYTLHKVPGALATYHECAMIAEQPTGFTHDAIDIISFAKWL
jgi:hypothetical protein